MWHFISSWVLGGRDVGLSLDLVFLGGGVCFLKWSFVGVGAWVGWFYFDYLLLRGRFVLKIFFSVLWWNFINICLTFTHSFTQFFCVLWGGVSVGRCAFSVFGHRHAAC